jgi:tripartite-type tricarboxylate transporter receptor subunit TctC
MAITSELIKSVTADLYNRSLRIMIASGEPTVMGPEEFAAYVKNDEKQLAPVIKALGLTNN